jgi:hypothetical protein
MEIFFFHRFNGEKGSNWIINRTLHTHNASKWTLNGKQTTEAAVKIVFFFEKIFIVICCFNRLEN